MHMHKVTNNFNRHLQKFGDVKHKLFTSTINNIYQDLVNDSAPTKLYPKTTINLFINMFDN